ncbi:sugar ABC transporter substrate-binding protein, partial [Streptomyces sp. NPDC056503]
MRSARLRRTRRASAVTLVSAMTLTALAACGTSSSDNDGGGTSQPTGSSDASAPLDPKTKVSITIDCMPPAAKAAELKEWKEDVAEFNK